LDQLEGGDVTAFVHEGVFYRDAEEFLAGTLPFVRAGVAAGEPVLLAVPGPNLALLTAALGAEAAAVEQVDMAEAGRNPVRILPGVLLAFAEAHPGRHVNIVGEPIWAGRTELEYPACAQHEALINAVFEDRDAAILCPYDSAGLAPEVLADAARTHPVLGAGADRWPSPDYADPVAVADLFNLPLPVPPRDAARLTFGSGGLPRVRRFVAVQGAEAGLPPEKVVDLTIAVNELATNTIAHAESPGELAIWRDNGQLVCQLDDAGHIADPLAGRIPPPGVGDCGRGLLIVGQLSDLVRIHTRPGRTAIRLHFRV